MRDCPTCIFRTERTYLRHGKIEFRDETPEVLITNKSGFCRLGFTQDPKTMKTKIIALKNGAQLCSFGMAPENGWPLAELALVHADSLNRALSALPFRIRLKDYL